jgi:hypothetical protein
MPRNRDEALTEYQQEIEAVLSCVAAVSVYSYPVTATEYMLVCEDQSGSTSLRLARGREMMPLDVSQRIQIFDGDNFRISTVKYFYVLWTPRPNERLIDWHYPKNGSKAPYLRTALVLDVLSQNFHRCTTNRSSKIARTP